MSKLIETIMFPIGLLFSLAWCKTLEAWNENIHAAKSIAIIALFIMATVSIIAEAVEYWAYPYFSATLWYRFPTKMYPAAHYRFFFIIQHFFEHVRYEVKVILEEVSDIYIEEVRELEGR